MNKKREPLRCGNTDRGKGKISYDNYTEEFTESQAEAVWLKDFRRICVGAAVVVILILLGVI